METHNLNNKDEMISASAFLSFFSLFFPFKNQVSILNVIGVIRYFQVKGYAYNPFRENC